MIKRNECRRLIWLATLLSAMGEVAMGQSSTGPPPIGGHETTQGTDSDATLLALEELKAAGTIRSS